MSCYLLSAEMSLESQRETTVILPSLLDPEDEEGWIEAFLLIFRNTIERERERERDMT